MDPNTDIVPAPPPSPIRLGCVVIESPATLVATATAMAGELSAVIKDRKLFNRIGGREYVRVEGWTTCAAMVGIVAREVDVQELSNGDFLATVELVRVIDGVSIGRGSAICGLDEPTWKNRPRYARRSMAVTRACGKACRLAFSWIVSLAGYEATPAEEMDSVAEAVAPPLTTGAASAPNATAPAHTQTADAPPSVDTY